MSRIDAASRQWCRLLENESQAIMSPDEEFVRARHPEAELVEISDPVAGQSKWCVHYHAEVDSKIMGSGNSIEEAWANARAKCADDPVIA